MRTLFLFLFMGFSWAAYGQTAGILGRQAPELGKLEWVDEKGKIAPQVSFKKLRGKVIYLHFFQSWCPGCLSSGLPSLKALSEKYADNPNIKFYAIQTVFEGFGVNTKSKVHSIRRRFDLKVPMAHDDGSAQGLKRSVAMTKFRSGGTPWTVLIDKKGRVVYNAFHLPIGRGTQIIDTLLK